MQGALELHDCEPKMGDEGWYIVEDAGGGLNEMTLHGRRTWALMALEIAHMLPGVTSVRVRDLGTDGHQS